MTVVLSNLDPKGRYVGLEGEGIIEVTRGTKVPNNFQVYWSTIPQPGKCPNRCTSTGCAVSPPALQDLMFQTQLLGDHWQTMGVGKSTVVCGTVSDRTFCADERCVQVSIEH
jgi:hypothetical protein